MAEWKGRAEPRIVIATSGADADGLGALIRAAWPAARIRVVPRGESERARPHDLFWDADGILAAGADAGLEGLAAAARYARQRDVPFLGVNAGFAAAVLDHIRDVAGLSATEAELFSPAAASVRRCRLVRETVLARAYRADEIEARCAAGYEYGGLYRDHMAQAGLLPAAEWPDGRVAAVALPRHKFYAGTQFLPAGASDPLLHMFCVYAQEFADTRPDADL